MCLRYFQGRGYSQAFTEHMTRIQTRITEETPVTLTAGADAICAACPNNRNGLCSSGEKADRYDRGVLSFCGLRVGETLPYGAFAALVEARILAPGRRGEICGDCRWGSLCGGNREEA